MISLIATAFVGAAAPASAADGPTVQQVNAFSAFDSTVYKSVRATCPGGQQVIGTGYRLLGAEGSVVLDDLIPDQTSVLVGAGEIVGPGEPSDGTTANWQIEATALCVPTSSMSLQIMSKTSDFKVTPGSLAHQDPAFLEVDCPGGSVPLGTGAALSNGFGQVQLASVAVTNHGGGLHVDVVAETDRDGYSGAWSVTGYAICGPALAGLHEAPFFPSNFDSSSPKTLTAACPFGQFALSTGWGGDDDEVVTGADIIQAVGFPTGYIVTASETAPGSSLNWTLVSDMSCADGTQVPLAAPNLNGAWDAGTGSARPVITQVGSLIWIDMSAYGRPTARGGVTDGTHITVGFPDDRTYTGTLVATNRILWSNGTSWTKI